MSACLPVRPRSRAQSFVARVRTLTGGLEQEYPGWIRRYEQTDERARQAAQAQIGGFSHAPLISILMPVVNPSPAHLRAAIQSVQVQFYPVWELCIALDASTAPSIATLLRQARAHDSRIKMTTHDGQATAASNAALRLATGQFVAKLDHHDLLSPRALFEAATRIAANPEIDIIYSDEDQIDESGGRSMPYFKSGWNPDLMLAQNMINHLGVYRHALINRIGGFRSELDGSPDYDLALRAVAKSTPERIIHIPRVLYHARQGGVTFSQAAQEQCAINGRRAVSDFLIPDIPDIRVEPVPDVPAWNRVIYPVPRPEPLVSVVIPTRNHADMLGRTVEGLLFRTDYPSIEVLIVDNGSDEPASLVLLDRLAQDSRVRVLRCPGPFNYSALNNRAVRDSAGALILLLNNDIDVIHPDWLREMVSQAIRPEIGAVGAKLLYPDGTIQHGGITVGMGGVAGHRYLHQPQNGIGYFGQLILVRNVMAVTGACLMVRRQTFLEVGGLDEEALPVAFNDVDLCLKLAEQGYRNLWTPYAKLYHYESASRGTDLTGQKAVRFKRELTHMRTRWGRRLDHDPYWNPNLSLHGCDILLAFPPRDGSGDQAMAA